MAKTLEEIRKEIKELKKQADVLEKGKISAIPKNIWNDLQKQVDRFVSLADGADIIAEIDITVKKYPVYVCFNSEFFEVSKDLALLEDNAHKTYTFYDVLTKNSDVKGWVKQVNHAFKSFWKQVKEVAKDYDCDMQDVSDELDPSYILHE